MRCSQCDTENTDGTKFCTNCGVKLLAPPTFCPKCGAEVSPGTRFCVHCGYDTDQSTSQEPPARKLAVATPEKKRNTTTIIIAIATVILVVGGGALLYFANFAKAPTAEKAIAYEDTTNSMGMAKFNLDGETISISVVNKTSPSQALSRVNVSVAEQQGIGLVYAKDRDGKFFPELTLLDSTSTQMKALTLAMTPVSDKSWIISQPMTVGINPKLLPEIDSVPYSRLLSFLEDEYPDIDTIVFLFDRNVGNIVYSTVSISESPYPGVIYAYLHKGQESASSRLFRQVYAVEPVTLLFVTASIVAATFDIPTSGVDLLLHLGKVYGEAKAGSPYAITMPDLSGVSEYNVERKLGESGLKGIPIEVLDEDIIERGYVKNVGDTNAIKLVGFVVRQLPNSNMRFNSDPDDRYWSMPDKVVVWIGRLGEDHLKAEPKEEPQEETKKKLIEEQTPGYQKNGLDDDYKVYYVTHEVAKGSDLVREINDDKISLRYKPASAKWRAHYVKEIDTQGAKKIRIKADLALIDHAKFFIESRGVGVKYDDYVDLMVLSSDPRPILDKECDRTLSTSEWATKCGIANTDPSVLGHSGIPKFTESKACDFEVDVAGKDKIYLVLRVADAWLADVEGVLSNLQIYYLASDAEPKASLPEKPVSLLASDAEYYALYTTYTKWGKDFIEHYYKYTKNAEAEGWTSMWFGSARDEERRLHFERVGDKWKPTTIPIPSP